MAREGLTGMLLGKFLPPTLGHRYMINFAAHYVDRLTVLVCSLESEPIPGELRLEWMKEMFPNVDVVHVTDENPQYPHEHPDFWNIWRDTIRRVLPEGPDVVFASEEYGFQLAEILGARYVPVDHARELVPISGTLVREDPMTYWDYIPSVVRPYFVRRVCIIGPESTGKSTLAVDLARHYRTVHAHEYARPLLDLHDNQATPERFRDILRGQAACEAALARQANRLLICDSDAFITALFHELFHGGRPDYIMEEAERHQYHLYLLTYHDAQYVDDGSRRNEADRPWFFEQCENWVRSRSTPYVVIRGGWKQRFATACSAVDRLLE